MAGRFMPKRSHPAVGDRANKFTSTKCTKPGLRRVHLLEGSPTQVGLRALRRCSLSCWGLIVSPDPPPRTAAGAVMRDPPLAPAGFQGEGRRATLHINGFPRSFVDTGGFGRDAERPAGELEGVPTQSVGTRCLPIALSTDFRDRPRPIFPDYHRLNRYRVSPVD